MAEIRPFCGVHYNQSIVTDLASVICPPYDIISPKMQQELYERNEYNFVRLEFNRALPRDTDTNNKYTRSLATLKQWLKLGVLKIDREPAIYVHDHYFTHQEKSYKRRGIVVVVRLEDWSKMVVRPHEGTLAAPKSDRLNLLWTLQANTSPILAMYEDLRHQVTSLLVEQAQNKPMFDIRNADGEGHTVWAITEPEIIERICSALSDQPLYIADGHHRYESALNYQRERRACSSVPSGDEPFDFVMMTLVDFSDPGLVILPAHRLVCGMQESVLGELMTKLKRFFDIDELPLDMPDLWQRVDDFLGGVAGEVRMALVGLSRERLCLLKLRDFTAASQMMPYFHSELYKRLNVSVVDHLILEEVLELDRNREESFLAYSHDRSDAVRKVLDQEYQLAFLLSPVKAGEIKAIADASDRMPRKSTYFYPKLPSGLVFHRLV